MTNYIEVMMRTAGVEKEEIKTPGRDWDNEGLASWYIEYVYPDFTPEKQLEIIKLIASKETYSDKGVELGMYYENNSWGIELWTKGGYTVIEFRNKHFTQALAQLTTGLMMAGELDKEKVKEILEC